VSDVSLLSDSLVRELVAVGQVDLLVGLPTLNNAATVKAVVRAVQAGCATYLPRARMVLLNSDSGSTDGTPALVQEASAEETSTVTASHRLRTAHRISTPYAGPPGKAGALRLIFASADLLQASVVAIVDPEMTSMTPQWVPALAGPILRDRVDMVAPVYARHPFEAPLATQLVRPLIDAVLARRVREPLANEFACSGRLAASFAEDNAWNSSVVQRDPYLWMLTGACAGDHRIAQAALGPRQLDSHRPMPALPELFQQVVGSVFDSLDAHAAGWITRESIEDVPIMGNHDRAATPPPFPDLARMSASFSENVRDLHPVLAEILPPVVLSGIVAAAGAPQNPAQYSDELWAETVFDFLLAYRRGVMRRDHILKALLPLYLGRTVSFLLRYRDVEPQAGEDGLEQLVTAFERARPGFVARWPQNP
jgi:hypothetical protein